MPKFKNTQSARSEQPSVSAAPKNDPRDLRPWLRFSGKLLFLAILSVVIFGIFFGFYRVNNAALDPQIKDGDLALYTRYDAQFSVDDRIVFIHDGKYSVSTVAALPGQVITMDKNGRLLANGSKIRDDAIYSLNEEKPELSFPFRVPSDSYFVLNTNLNDYNDSRSFGALPKADIKGKIISILRTRGV